MLFSYFQHKHDCRWKQVERQEQINALPRAYFTPLTPHDAAIHRLSIPQIVARVRDGSLTRAEVLLAFGKKTLQAHTATNCLAEVLIADAATSFASFPASPASSTANAAASLGPLAGVPVSVKDSELVKGYDATIGFSAWVRRPAPHNSPIVRLLLDAGALLLAKTSVPTTLLSTETASDLLGRTRNPYNAQYASGASSGGAGALVAFGGVKADVGTDLAGSVRCPAHFSGVYSVKGSAGRFPAPGGVSSIYGLEGVNLVAAPIARSLDDLAEFWKGVFAMKPWTYDPSCIPLPWRAVTLPKKVRWGVIWDDGIVPPSPACKRALQAVVDALRAQEDHEVVDFEPPSPFEALSIGSQLIFADGGKQLVSAVRPGETLDPGVRQIRRLLRTPKWLVRLYAWLVRTVWRDALWADLLAPLHEKGVPEQWALVVRREQYRMRWHEAWSAQGVDFVLSVPYATPAIPSGGMKNASVGIAHSVLLWNVLDYTAGVLPVTFVDAVLDELPANFRSTVRPALNTLAKGVLDNYDAAAMHGLPVGVQVAGRRLEEEKVIEGMRTIESALKSAGKEFVPKEF